MFSVHQQLSLALREFKAYKIRKEIDLPQEPDKNNSLSVINKITGLFSDTSMDESCAATTEDAESKKKKLVLETEDERKTRLLSLKIIYFTMFLMTLGFSIILTGIWPYLDKVSEKISSNLLMLF